MLKTPSIINGNNLLVDKYNAILLSPKEVKKASQQREVEDLLKAAIRDQDDDAIIGLVLALKDMVSEERYRKAEEMAGLR